ncbi:hypothetical protein BBW65_04190 [Helicobacter enhydrae]|uniref:Outer membrane protein beta-barrel domain-containing protein n=1 Tax=Helicobacter enhydrae TaxID=222136 RepID=A0A1B1U5M3_9HELI|nr:hypothetical protein [Helicobacter enhydrae]ANV98050.1 hypothetical protein BBW65_04190 [Helicobacter enhydrae]
MNSKVLSVLLGCSLLIPAIAQEKPQNDKSGFLMGFEFETTQVDIYQKFTTTTGGQTEYYGKKDETLFLASAVLGYQHYFGEIQGIATKVTLGAGLYPVEVSTSGIKVGQNQSVDFTTSFLPIKSSVELSYLLDFVNSGLHSLGLDLTLGYEFGVNLVAHSMQPGDKNMLTTLFTQNLYPKVGLHYIYGNHQFNLSYKFLRLLNKAQLEILNGDVVSEWKFQSFAYNLKNKPSDLSFSYIYRY